MARDVAARDAPWIAVVGPADAPPEVQAAAEDAGAAVAEAGAVLVCGGLGGVMEAACRGSRSKLGLTVGILPGDDRADANGWVTIALPTGLGEGRNALVVRSADAVVAVGGSWGTLSEIAFACRAGKPVAVVGGWVVSRDGQPTEELVACDSAAGAVASVLGRLSGR